MLAYKAGQKVVTGLLRTVFRARVTGLPREGRVRKYTGYSRQSHEGFF